jgi:hypothetical protein
MMIDHLRLARLDGSQLRLDDVEASGEVRQGAVIVLTIPDLGLIRAQVNSVDDKTTTTQSAYPDATGQLTVGAAEIP